MKEKLSVCYKRVAYLKIMYFQLYNLLGVSQMAVGIQIICKITVLKIWKHSKGGLTRNDLYDTICMTLIRF